MRSAIELFFLEHLSPLDETKGYNRFKLWVGMALFCFQFTLKLEAANVIFEKKVRKIILVLSIFNMTYNIMRLQASMVYRPFGKDLENLAQVIALGGLLTSNFLVIFNANK